MPENYLFEYAVVRMVPRVEREEFLNVGVIFYCQKLKFLHILFDINKDRLKAFAESVDIEDIKEYLQSFERICKGGREAGPIGQLDIASRFRWLTATRSTIVQTSKVHPGFCTDGKEKLTQLFTELVL